MRREFKGLGLNSCVALRKPLISKANQGKKGFNLLGSVKIRLWSNGSGHVVWWVQTDPVQEWWAHQGKKRGRWSDTPIMPSAYCTSLWGQCCVLGLLQLVRSGFCNIMCQKNEVSWLPEFTEWPGYSINAVFPPWRHGHILRWQCHDSSG